MADIFSGAGAGLGRGLSGQPNTYGQYYAAGIAAKERKAAAATAKKAKDVDNLSKKISGIKLTGIDPFYQAPARQAFEKAINGAQDAFAKDPNNGLSEAQNILSKFSADLSDYQGKSKLVGDMRTQLQNNPQGLYDEQKTLLNALNTGDRESLKRIPKTVFGTVGYDETMDLPFHAPIAKDINIQAGLDELVKNKDFADVRDQFKTVASGPGGQALQVQYSKYSPQYIDNAVKSFLQDKGVYSNIGRELETKGLINPQMTKNQIDQAIYADTRARMKNPEFIHNEFNVPRETKDNKAFSISDGVGMSDKFRYVYGQKDNRVAKELWSQAISSMGAGSVGGQFEGEIKAPDFSKFISIARTDAQENTIQPFYDNKGNPIQARPMGLERVGDNWTVKVLKTTKRGSGKETFSAENIPYTGENKGRLIAEYDNVEDFIKYADKESGHPAVKENTLLKGTETNQTGAPKSASLPVISVAKYNTAKGTKYTKSEIEAFFGNKYSVIE